MEVISHASPPAPPAPPAGQSCQCCPPGAHTQQRESRWRPRLCTVPSGRASLSTGCWALILTVSAVDAVGRGSVQIPARSTQLSRPRCLADLRIPWKKSFDKHIGSWNQHSRERCEQPLNRSFMHPYLQLMMTTVTTIIIIKNKGTDKKQRWGSAAAGWEGVCSS